MNNVETHKFDTVAEIVETLGGAAHISRELGLRGPSTISEMKRRNSIPVRLWPDLIKLANGMGFDGFDSDTLMNAHTPEEPAAA